MKCEEVSRELIEHLNHRADSAQRRDVEDIWRAARLAEKRAEEFHGIWNVMDELPAVEPSFGFDARVRQRVAAEPRRKWFELFVPQPRLALAVGLLIALLVLVMKLPLKNPGTTVDHRRYAARRLQCDQESGSAGKLRRSDQDGCALRIDARRGATGITAKRDSEQ